MPAPRERGPAHTPPPHRARASRGAGQRDRWHPDREMKRQLDSSGTDRLLWKWLEEGQQQDRLSRGESAPPPPPPPFNKCLQSKSVDTPDTSRQSPLHLRVSPRLHRVTS